MNSLLRLDARLLHAASSVMAFHRAHGGSEVTIRAILMVGQVAALLAAAGGITISGGPLAGMFSLALVFVSVLYVVAFVASLVYRRKAVDGTETYEPQSEAIRLACMVAWIGMGLAGAAVLVFGGSEASVLSSDAIGLMTVAIAAAIFQSCVILYVTAVAPVMASDAADA